MPKIIFEVNPESGEMTVEVEGVAGPACERALERLDAELGRPADERRTAEYQLDRQHAAVRQRAGQR